MESPVSNETTLLFTLLEYATPVIVALMGWLSLRLTSWLKAKMKNELAKGVLIRVNETVMARVREAEQTLVASLKKAREPDSEGGSSLTENEARNVKKTVLDNLKKMWGPKGLNDLKKVLGVDDDGLNDYLSAKIEETVLVEKRASMIPESEATDGE